MPTEAKIKKVQELRRWMEECSVAIATDYTGLPVSVMNQLRATLRERGARYRVVKNTLTYLAAEAAGQPGYKEVVQGPTGIAFGQGDPVETAKALTEFIRSNRVPMTIRGAVLDGRVLSPQEVEALASLPGRDQLAARLVGQLQAPIAGLVYVLNGTVAALARVLQRRVEQLQEQAA